MLILIFTQIPQSNACSVFYFIDKNTGKIYVANLEDFWYDVKPYIQIIPGSKNKMARLWYGWDDFAQGGINEAGLFFDGAVTPEQKMAEGYHKPKGNLGDQILANCKTVDEAVDFLEFSKTALSNAHMMFGDSSGKAVVVEWIDGIKQVVPIQNNQLIMTNFLLSDTSKGNFPCRRYQSIETNLRNLGTSKDSLNLVTVGNAIAGAASTPQTNNDGKKGGTLYSTFINITDMEFVVVYKLNNSTAIKLDLTDEFNTGKKRKIRLKN